MSTEMTTEDLLRLEAGNREARRWRITRDRIRDEHAARLTAASKRDRDDAATDHPQDR